MLVMDPVICSCRHYGIEISLRTLKAPLIETVSTAETKYSVHSLRHLNALNALRNGVGVLSGLWTSVQIIQEYYGKQATSANVCDPLGRLIYARPRS